jgi:DNA-binding MarR family transcriptional regulator
MPNRAARAPQPRPMPSRAAGALRLDDYLPYRLSVAANAVSQLIARAYRDRFGLKVPEWRLIAVLADAGPLTPQALCERTVMDKVTVTRAAQGLARRRLVQREPHASDGRSHRLKLTAAGRRLHEQIAPLALHYQARLLCGMDSRAIETLERQLRRLQQAAGALEPAVNEWPLRLASAGACARVAATGQRELRAPSGVARKTPVNRECRHVKTLDRGRRRL